MLIYDLLNLLFNRYVFSAVDVMSWFIEYDNIKDAAFPINSMCLIKMIKSCINVYNTASRLFVWCITQVSTFVRSIFPLATSGVM
jgi:hypothetical protein